MYNELQHHGIKGMHWGIRRFQNPDGTLTSAGRDRYGNEHDQRIKEGFLNRNGIRSNPSVDTPRSILAGRPVSAGGTIKKVGDVSREARNATNNAKNINDRVDKKKKDQKVNELNVKDMSDKELRDAVTRMNLERQYKDMSRQKMSTGREKVGEILDTAGDVLGIVTSAAVIYSTIRKAGGH